MKRTGILVITDGVAEVTDVPLARAAAGDPFGAAINFLANRGLDEGDFIWVTGTDGVINTTAVMFISEAGPAFAAAALEALTAALPPAALAGDGGSGSKGSSKGAAKKGAAKKPAGKKSANK